MHTMRTLLPYLWPENAAGLRLRVIAAMTFLILAKVATLYVPIFYKHAVDALGVRDAGALVTVPLAIIAAYGLARVLSQVFAELRDIMFIRVQARGLRQVAREVFEHLHTLSLRFHLDRRTGGLSSVLERGTVGIETLLRFMLFNIVPTLIEILLVTGLLWVLFNIWFAIVTLVTMVGYIVFTFVVAEWRVKYRRQMNLNDTEAKTKAVDSLLNYETVKYFTNEATESARYDLSLAKREQAFIKTGQSLSLLNIGQALILSVGVALIMWMAARGVSAGTMTVGDFVLVNAYMLQLAVPLSFIGFVYNEIRRALIDMEDMFQLQRVEAEIQDRPGATALALSGGSVTFEDVRFAYDSAPPDFAGCQLHRAGPGKRWRSSARRARVSPPFPRLLYRFYQPQSGRITIDGQDINAITQASLRAAIGIVPQDTVLFNDTIGYNIGYGMVGATDAQIAEAARLAHIDGFVDSLPDRYATQVGERGLKLSGGEKHRVAHRPHRTEIAAHPAVRRSHQRARQPDGAGDPAQPARNFSRAHDTDHRPPPLDHHRCRRDPGARPRPGG